MLHSGCHFLRFWRIRLPKLSILGPPWRPAGHQMTPKIAQVTSKMVSENSRGDYIAPTCSQDHFWSAPGHHFRRFRMIWGSFLMDLGIIFDGFWLLLCSSICRMSKPPGTKRNSGKHQEHADNCRNMQTSSARKNKSPNSDRDTASCKMQIAATNANLQIRGRRCSRR